MKNFLLTTFAIIFIVGISKSQSDTMYIYKSGAVVNKYAVSTIDSIIFYKAVPRLMDIDGNTYPIVTIGSQVWMAENLRVMHYSDGSPVSTTTSVFDNNNTNLSTYGLLYDWATAMKGAASSATNPSNVRGICPAGWHLPSEEEWIQLEIYLGMNASVARNTTGMRGTNQGTLLQVGGSTGFNAVLGGYYLYNHNIAVNGFMRMNLTGYYWSSTTIGFDSANSRAFTSGEGGVQKMSNNLNDLVSVRCVKD